MFNFFEWLGLLIIFDNLGTHIENGLISLGKSMKKRRKLK